MPPTSGPTDAESDSRRGRLRLPPGTAGSGAVPPGRHLLEVDGAVAGICHLPAVPPRRLMIMLHGAGGSAEAGLRLLLPYAGEYGLAVYAPRSAEVTWDRIVAGYGPDVRRIQAALTRLAGLLPPLGPPVIGGFSDGASYALSLALINGDVFDRVVAFSPGFVAPGERTGRPRVFLSHGRGDRVLPIDRCGRRVARLLTATGYAVEYREFDGGHEVPADVAVAALEWLSD
jgi:phospholipase/carboxylesterase